jgi:hypothetical protein
MGSPLKAVENLREVRGKRQMGGVNLTKVPYVNV